MSDRIFEKSKLAMSAKRSGRASPKPLTASGPITDFRTQAVGNQSYQTRHIKMFALSQVKNRPLAASALYRDILDIAKSKVASLGPQVRPIVMYLGRLCLSTGEPRFVDHI